MTRKRYICVPINKNAQKCLDFDAVASEDILELVLADNEYSYLYQKGLFELINNYGNTSIDDFEDASIEDKLLLENVIRNIETTFISGIGQEPQIVYQLLASFKEALKRNTGVYFYF